jgi:hypothetical protein
MILPLTLSKYTSKKIQILQYDIDLEPSMWIYCFSTSYLLTVEPRLSALIEIPPSSDRRKFG